MERSIRKSIPRIGAEDLATGRRRFSDDIPLCRPLILRVVRGARAHAKILKVDVERARAISGVVGVLTAADIPGKNLFGLITKDQPVLAHTKVRFLGEAIALVAAESEERAEEAADEVHIEYEDLPCLFDPEGALQEDAPKIHDKGNLLFRRLIRKGDVQGALAESHRVVRQTYVTPMMEHSYLEPDAGVGYVDGDGILVIFASTQNPHYDRLEVARILGLEENKIRVVQAATGGGFGSKLDLTVQAHIALAVHHFRRPVRLVYSREEVFLATSKRHSLKMEMETGVSGDGRLLGLRAKILCDTGAYASYGIAVATRAAIHAAGPYEVANVEVESLCVYTNNPVAGAMRGFGVPQITFAHESQMDLLAQELGMDPLRIRLINALRPGGKTATGQELRHSVGIVETLEAIEPYYEKARSEWKKEGASSRWRRGVGIGAMWYGIGNTGIQNPSAAMISMSPSGRVTLLTGAADIGQGSTTVLSQIAAEVLKMDPHDICLVIADTGRTGNAGATSASRQTYVSGNAVKEAAERLANVLLTEAADVLKRPKEALIFEGGGVRDKGDPDRRVPLSTLAVRASRKGIPLCWEGYFDPVTTPLTTDNGQGSPYATYAFASHMAVVCVDTLTGQVKVEKVVAAHDVGRAINPQAVEGQIQGGVVMGIGFALMEELVQGKTLSLAEYRIPTALDVPSVLTIIVENEEPSGPYGAKGVGEPAIIPAAPAIVNAIQDATGVRITRLPATPEKVRAAMQTFKLLAVSS